MYSARSSLLASVGAPTYKPTYKDFEQALLFKGGAVKCVSTSL